MEATKVSFFKNTKEAINKELTPREKGKLRLERINKLCPETGATLQEMMKIAGYDPGLPKDYQAGASFINYHRKKGNILEVPNVSDNKYENFLLIPANKVKTSKVEKVVEEIKEEVKPTIQAISIAISDGENTYNFEFKNVEPTIAKNRISKFLESFNE